MKIILYKTADENIKVKKNLTDSIDLNGFIRSECSILSPSIEIDTPLNICTYNYVYIEDFNRYYYIQDIVSIGKDLWSLSLRCDVLMSYADEIKKLQANVLRQKSDFNLMLEDNQLNSYADDRVQCYNFPVSLTPNTNQFKYYLTLIGGGE